MEEKERKKKRKESDAAIDDQRSFETLRLRDANLHIAPLANTRANDAPVPSCVFASSI